MTYSIPERLPACCRFGFPAIKPPEPFTVNNTATLQDSVDEAEAAQVCHMYKTKCTYPLQAPDGPFQFRLARPLQLKPPLVSLSFDHTQRPYGCYCLLPFLPYL